MNFLFFSFLLFEFVISAPVTGNAKFVFDMYGKYYDIYYVHEVTQFLFDAKASFGEASSPLIFHIWTKGGTVTTSDDSTTLTGLTVDHDKSYYYCTDTDSCGIYELTVNVPVLFKDTTKFMAAELPSFLEYYDEMLTDPVVLQQNGNAVTLTLMGEVEVGGELYTGPLPKPPGKDGPVTGNVKFTKFEEKAFETYYIKDSVQFLMDLTLEKYGAPIKSVFPIRVLTKGGKVDDIVTDKTKITGLEVDDEKSYFYCTTDTECNQADLTIKNTPVYFKGATQSFISDLVKEINAKIQAELVMTQNGDDVTSVVFKNGLLYTGDIPKEPTPDTAAPTDTDVPTDSDVTTVSEAPSSEPSTTLPVSSNAIFTFTNDVTKLYYAHQEGKLVFTFTLSSFNMGEGDFLLHVWSTKGNVVHGKDNTTITGLEIDNTLSYFLCANQDECDQANTTIINKAVYFKDADLEKQSFVSDVKEEITTKHLPASIEMKKSAQGDEVTINIKGFTGKTFSGSLPDALNAAATSFTMVTIILTIITILLV